MGRFLINPEDQDLLDAVRDFCQNEIKEQCKATDVSGEFPQELTQACCEMGLGSLEVPEEYGGPGLSYITRAALYEELAVADAGIFSTFMASAIGYELVHRFGSKEQIEKVSDIVVSGGIGAFCLTEPDAGSDASNNKAFAVRDGDSYVINGRKCFITNGAIADYYVVFAMTDKTLGTRGMSAFLVYKGTPGLSAGHEENKMGIRNSNTTDVVLEDVRVPAENLLGQEGKAFGYAMKALDVSRANCAVGALGVCRRAIEEAVSYAKTRVTFGQPIAKHQVIQFKIADMQIREDAARALIERAYAIYEAGGNIGPAAAAAKCFAGDSAVQNTLDAMQIMGGYGYSREYPVEKLLRDAKIFQIYEGTNEVQRMVVAREAIGKF